MKWRKRQGTRADWLNPRAYDALSRAEKRALWARRKRDQAARRNRSGRRKSSSDTTWIGWAMVATLVGVATVSELSPTSLFSRPVPTATGATEVRASFSLCHTGGGYNCVVDGDTIWLEGQNIRVADIDAPETHEPRCPSEKELGDRATLRLQQLVNSGAVTLQPIDRDEDNYGRKLRIVLVDGASVGDALVSEGLARWYAGGRRPWC